jgi:hypothetical protein
MNLLLKNCHTLVTMVDGEKPLHGVDVLLEGGRVSAVGPGAAARPPAPA